MPGAAHRCPRRPDLSGNPASQQILLKLVSLSLKRLALLQRLSLLHPALDVRIQLEIVNVDGGVVVLVVHSQGHVVASVDECLDAAKVVLIFRRPDPYVNWLVVRE